VYTSTRPLHPATIVGFYQQNDVRLTPPQLARVVEQPLTEIARLGIQPSADGRIGRDEVAFLEAVSLAAL
jgi:hypothetical protein